MNANEKQILADAVKVLSDLAVTFATGGAASAVLVADVPMAKDALERILLEFPPVDATALAPAERAAADAASQAAEDAKFPKS